jgi:bilirubin oxidase
MQFRVSATKVADTSTPVKNLGLPAPVQLGTATVTRKLSLNEEESETVFVPVDENGEYILDGKGALREVSEFDPFAAAFGPTEAVLGTVDEGGFPVLREWMDAISENPAVNSTEVWEIYNFTADAHPIHIHDVSFEVVGRRRSDGSRRPRESWEAGRKDTVIAYPGEITLVKARFARPGLFVWHCHILEHEDNEMMRPYRVVP